MSLLRLVERRALSARAVHFVFQAEFRHASGQYLALSGGGRKGYYSIASAPRDDRTIDFCIDARGDFGQYLAALPLGAEVEAEGPAGKMRLQDAANAAVYFAAGTGIAPVRAILQAHLAANPEADARLVFGVRHSRDLFYRGEFEALAAQRPNFAFLPTVSGGEPEWSGRRGRVSAHIAEALSGGADRDACFCGPREMVEQLRAGLTAAGIPDERQSYERYQGTS